MWREIRRETRRFDSAVLTMLNPDGPVSTRCRPDLSPTQHTLLVGVVDDPWPGPASILYHRHDDRLWKLRSCLILGQLRREVDDWLFVPERFVPGMGVGGVFSYIRFLRQGRRTATRYLRVRGLDRPTVEWDEVASLLEAAASEKP